MSILFARTAVRGMELKNRLVRSATHEGMADRDGFPTQDLIRLYKRLAKGGVGLIITGYASVTPARQMPFHGDAGHPYGWPYPGTGRKILNHHSAVDMHELNSLIAAHEKNRLAVCESFGAGCIGRFFYTSMIITLPKRRQG
jgi:hypothetical protein